MTNKKYKIREICGDWALDIPFPGSVLTIFFNSRVNAELVKKILIHEDEHPNEAVPFNPCTYTPVHIDREKWEPCECCREPIGAEPYAKEKYPGICDFEVILDGGDEIAVNSYNHYTPVTEEVCFSFPVSFCPKCGRPLTDQAWDELEKRMRGTNA